MNRFIPVIVKTRLKPGYTLIVEEHTPPWVYLHLRENGRHIHPVYLRLWEDGRHIHPDVYFRLRRKGGIHPEVYLRLRERGRYEARSIPLFLCITEITRRVLSLSPCV